jgi:hypothetical protein
MRSSPRSSLRAVSAKSPERSRGTGRSGAGGPDEVEHAWITAPVESMISLLDGSYLGRA